MSDAGEGGKARAQAAGDAGNRKGPAGSPTGKGAARKYSGALVVAIGILIAFGISKCGGDGSSSVDEQVQRDDAKSACHQWVKDKLKAPSTAKFTDLRHTGTAGTYTFTGAVDAQNSFGAMIRSTWSCDIRSSGDEWKGSASVIDGGQP